jgi:hypothetical protein
MLKIVTQYNSKNILSHCSSAECLCYVCHFAESFYAERRFAKCRNEKCHYTKSRGASPSSLRLFIESQHGNFCQEKYKPFQIQSNLSRMTTVKSTVCTSALQTNGSFHAHTEMVEQSETETDGRTDRLRDLRTDSKMDRRTYRGTDRETDRQAKLFL